MAIFTVHLFIIPKLPVQGNDFAEKVFTNLLKCVTLFLFRKIVRSDMH